MDELRLNDGTRIPIETGASLAHIEHIAPNEPEALAICELITPANLAHVEFLVNERPAGVYDNLVIIDQPSRTTLENGTVLVEFGLRELSELEIRVNTHDEEITELQEAIAESEV